MSTEEQARKQKRGGERAVAILLVALVAVVAFWEVMSNRSKQPFRPFTLTSEDFLDFKPKSDDWQIQSVPLQPDPIEPNIVAYVLTPLRAGPAAARLRVVVRLVHGYNMVDCMREKGYTVDLLADTRDSTEDKGRIEILGATKAPLQAWRLTSRPGDASYTITSMLRDGDFTETNVDTRSMAFPRIGIPDNPGWFPQGFSMESLKRPIHNGRLFLRAKWNSSRMDVMTFLGLKQPAWASDDMLTLVAQGPRSAGDSLESADEIRHVLSAHRAMHKELASWRRENLDAMEAEEDRE